MERNTKWYKLDNAAKIIPSTAKGANTRVFRISCELKEEVDGGILQMALNEVIPDFSFFNCILKRGLFWYYMEDTNIMPKVEDDNLPACSPLYIQILIWVHNKFARVTSEPKYPIWGSI